MYKANNSPLPLFGARLRRLRRAAGVKQFALAHALKVDQATVSRWEAGKQTPEAVIQLQAFETVSSRTDDAALRRLVEISSDCLHLVEESNHVCLAYSHSRAKDWQTSPRALLGVSLWQFATDEIRQAEAKLADTDWWFAQMPTPKIPCTSEARHDIIRISAGGIKWERLYLADGTPVRLVSGI